VQRFLIAAILLAFEFNVSAAETPQVTLIQGEHTVKCVIDDEAFFAYQFDVGRRKPFFLPVAAPGAIELLKQQLASPSDEPGATASVFVVQENAEIHSGDDVADHAKFGDILTATKIDGTHVFVSEKKGWIHQHDVIPLLATVTRLINDNPPKGVPQKDATYYDHPHHKGVWLSVDEVNGIEYWSEKGKIVNRGVKLVSSSGDSAIMQLTNDWVDDDDQPVVHEVTTVTVFPDRLINFSVLFTAGEKPVTFGDTKEGMFAIRVPNSMREFVGGGPVVNAEGIAGTAELWGKASAWIDYSGPVGANRFGVTLMDAPENFHPSRYHVRDYGLFGINPFGAKAYSGDAEPAAPLALDPGQSFTLRYGLYVHTGNAAEGKVVDVYQQFTDVKH